MAQNIAEFVVKATPVQTTATTQFTLASFDMAAIPGGIGNVTDCTVFVRATTTLFEVGGGTYSSTWEKCATFRRTSTNNPALVGSVENGNPATDGRVGMADTAAITMDVSTTTIRLRVTPSSASPYDWYAKLAVIVVQRA